MGQREAIAWLEENPGWHRIGDITIALGQGEKAVLRALAKATALGDIQSKMVQYHKEWSRC